MRTFRTSRAFILGVFALLAGCGDDQDSVKKKQPAETACDDGADNDKDGRSDCDDLDCRVVESACALAPPLDRSVATTLIESSRFLYTGPDPLQKNADEKAFDERRVAMVRGRVVDSAGEPLAGVKVTVGEHDDYGYTLTRPDGFFDLAVNGGTRLVMKYELNGYIPAERVAQPGWQRHAELPEVGLIEASSNRTKLDADAGDVQVALADATDDAFGKRQLLVLMQPGTRASAELPDGSDEDLSTLTLAVTEYPFEAMDTQETWQATARFAPGTLPLAGGVHYGMELRVDEAERLDARWVSFSKPVSIYVENFLNLPVGAPVPLGYYDRKVAQWQPAQGGRVIEIVGVESGQALVDSDGDGEADGADVLDDLGVTSGELAELGKRYEVGTELWRAMVEHFSPWDVLFPVNAPPGAIAPNAGGIFARPIEVMSRRGAAVVESQAMSQDIAITGTPYTLHYQSDRTTDYVAGFQVEVPLVPETVPAGLKSVRLTVKCAGKKVERFFDPEPNLLVNLEWNGEDAFKRRVQGPQTAEVTIGYVFDGVISIGKTFGSSGVATAVSTQELGIPILGAVVSQTFEAQLGVWDARGYDLGGFALDVQHAYDAVHRRVFFGYGDERRGENVGLVVHDLGQDFDLGTPDGVALAPDGSLVITDDQNDDENARGRILRLTPAGELSVVAGPGAEGPGADVEIGLPQGIVVAADGSIIVADFSDDAVKRIFPDGSMEIMVEGSDLLNVDGIALGLSEDLFIVDEDQVFRFSAGELTVFAGGGTSREEGIPATEAELLVPSAVAVASDGSVFISERGDIEGTEGHRIRKVSPDGTIRTIAGTGTAGFSGDGGKAIEAQFDNPRGITLGADGSLYVADQENNRVRRITPDGLIQSVVGGGNILNAEGQLADDVALTFPDGIALGKDGKLFVATGSTVFRVAPGLPELSNHDDFVPSVDGRTLYRFDHRGKHVETVDAMTGVTEQSFTYDDEGRLVSVSDHNGLETTIERTRRGAPSAIVAPFGQRTELELDDDGRIVGVKDALERAYSFDYKTDTDLVETMTDRRGGVHTFGYDDRGLLQSTSDPTGYFQNLTPRSDLDGYSVSVETPEERVFDYGAHVTQGSLVRSVDYPDTTKLSSDDEIVSRTSHDADGTTLTTKFKADDFFGPQSLFPEQITMTTPGGRTLTALGLRRKRLSDEENALSVEAWTESFDVNGRAFQKSYFREEQALADILPSGRQMATFYDERGRPTDVVVPGMGVFHNEYDENGNVISVTRSADDEEDRVQTLEYADDGTLAASTDAAGNTTTFTRDLVGRVQQTSLPDGNVSSFVFDENDNLVALTPPGRDAYTFEYDLADKLVASAAPRVDQASPSDLECGETEYEYTASLELARTRHADGRGVVRSYDENGRIASVELADAEITLAYDAGGKLARVNRNDSVRVDMSYDGPLWTGTTWAGAVDGSIEADYDENFRLSMLTVNDAHTVRFAYDEDDLVVGASASGGAFSIDRDPESGLVRGTALAGVTTALGYNGFGEVSTLRANFGGGAFRQDIERDTLGRVVRISEVSGTNETELEYSYDERGRLVEAARNGETTTYTYDENGNRLSVERPGEAIVLAEYDAQDRILVHGDQEYEQSPDGELFRRDNGELAVELTYDELGNLMNAILSDETDSIAVEYVVDGFGRRVGRRRNGSFTHAWFYKDKLRPIAEINAEGVFSHFVYTSNDSAPDVIFRAGVPHRVIKDHLGSVRVVVNAVTGVIAQELAYDEFGRVLADTNPGFQPFGFAGGLFDPDTKLVRFGTRDYDPGMGRWTAKDPISFDGGDTNLYRYCGGDPVNFTDPTGEAVPLVIAGVCAAGACEAIVAAAATAAVWTAATAAAVWSGLEIGKWFAQRGRGNVADTGIANAAQELIAQGLASTRCAALDLLMDEANRRNDSALKQRIKKTQKAWGCRHHS